MHVWMKVKCSEEIYYGWVYVWGTLHYPSLDWGWKDIGLDVCERDGNKNRNGIILCILVINGEYYE